MRLAKQYWFLVLYHLLIASSADAAPQYIELTDGSASYNLSNQIGYIADKTSTLRVSDIEKLTFIDNKAPLLNFGFNNATYWLKIPIKNNSTLTRYVLDISNTGFDEVDFFVPNSSADTGYDTFQAGDCRPYADRQIKTNSHSFYLDIPRDSSLTTYLRFNSGQSLFAFVTLKTELAFIGQLKDAQYKSQLNLGIVLGRFIFHIALLFFFFENKNFRAYSFFGIVACMQFISGTGGAISLFPHSHYLTNLAGYLPYALVISSFAYYIYEIFEVKKHFPKFVPVIYILGGLGLLFLSINLFVNDARVSYAFEHVNLFGEAIFIGFIVYAYYKGLRPSIWYVLPILFYLLPNFLWQVRHLGIEFPGIISVFIFMIRVEMLFAFLLIAILLRQANKEKVAISNALLTEKLEAEKLIELDRSKTNFFANVTHEFRTPLTLLASPLDDLIKRFPHEDIFKMMQRNARRLLGLVNELLDLNKLDVSKMKLDPSKIRAKPFFNTILNAFNSLAEQKNIQYAIEVDVPQEIYLDRDKVEKVINNLLSNAIKFTPDGGRVKAGIRNPSKVSQLQIKVIDSGPGLRPEDKEHIFDRFYQVGGTNTKTSPGTGIGLALTKKLVELMGGTISVESKYGEGSTFDVILPTHFDHLDIQQNDLVDGEVSDYFTIENTKRETTNGETHETVQNQLESMTSSAPTILIIEDEPDMLAFIKKVLSKDYKVITAVNGDKGLNLAFEMIPDVIISDVMMPIKDGYEVLSALRSDARCSHVPVIMLTAKSDFESKLEGLKTGANAYLTKPFRTEELRVRIAQLIERQKQLHKQFAQSGALPSISKTIPVGLSSLDKDFLGNINQLLDQNLSQEDFGVEQLADQLEISRVHLHRKLKGLTNMTPTELIKNYRLDKAFEMLKAKDKRVSEIAFAVGFKTQPYFSTEFKKRFNKKPSQV